MKIVVDEKTIAATGDDPDKVLRAHGYDPESVEYTVEYEVNERLADIENAVGKDGPGRRGVAQRIDELEDEMERIKDEIGLS